eukprot:3595379-Pleurochrysis_carterae.AAC.1
MRVLVTVRRTHARARAFACVCIGARAPGRCRLGTACRRRGLRRLRGAREAAFVAAAAAAAAAIAAAAEAAEAAAAQRGKADRVFACCVGHLAAH